MNHYDSLSALLADVIPPEAPAAFRSGRHYPETEHIAPAYPHLSEDGRRILDGADGRTAALVDHVTSFPEFTERPSWNLSTRGTLVSHTDVPCKLGEGIWKWLVAFELDIAGWLKDQPADVIDRVAAHCFGDRDDLKDELIANVKGNR